MARFNFLLLVIIILASVLRVYRLDQVPASLFGDEIDVGYQAYSLLKTGSDIHGRFLPFYIKSLSEYRAPLYIYSDVPFVAVFGLNEWGVRIAAAFWGVIGVLAIYLVAKQLLSKKVAILSALFLAISPWHIQYSRASFEATMLLAFVLIGTYLFLRSLKRNWYLPLSLLFFGLTPYIYSTAVVFTPVWILTLVLIFRNHFLNKEYFSKQVKVLMVCLAVLIVCAIPNLDSIYKGEATERFGVISIFRDSVLLDKINIARKAQNYFAPNGEVVKTNLQFEGIFHNKPLIYGQVFAQNYLNALSLDFLFTSGDPNFRQSVFEMGELYIADLIFIILGLIFVFPKLEKSTKWLIVGWFLVAPIPASLTSEGGRHATRLFVLLPPLILVSAMGANFILENFRLKYVKYIGTLVFILVLLNFSLYLHRYFFQYPIESWRWWHTGYKEAINTVIENEAKYKLVVINNTYEPTLMRYLFYSKYDPAVFQKQFNDDKMVFDIIPGVKGFYLNDHVAFGYMVDKAKKDGGLENHIPKDVLYLASARDEAAGDLRTYQHSGYEIIQTIVNPLNEPILYVLGGK